MHDHSNTPAFYRDLLDELDALSDEPAKIWRPMAGDALVGEVMVSDDVASIYDAEKIVPHLVIATPEGDQFEVYANHTMLASEIKKHSPQVGDAIAIRRLADVAGKNYKRYRVLVKQGAANAATLDDVDEMFGPREGR